MKKLWLFGIIGLSILVVNIVTAGHGSGWPGHHRCFIETAAGDNSVENEVGTPVQNTDDDIIAYQGGGGGHGGSYYGHGGYYRGHNSHHHGGHHDYCFIDTVLSDNWFEKILDFIWRPRS
jgi:hypothetical protein